MTYAEMAKELAERGYRVDRAKNTVYWSELKDKEKGSNHEQRATNATLH